jgi:hypothetical protein
MNCITVFKINIAFTSIKFIHQLKEIKKSNTSVYIKLQLCVSAPIWTIFSLLFITFKSEVKSEHNYNLRA